MPRIAKVAVDLHANTKKFVRDIQGARGVFHKFGKAVGTIAKAAAGAVTLISGGLTALAIKQSAVIDETAKLSRALGVNIREFQALALVASESAITQDQLGNMITKSQRSIVEASRGLQTYARSFETLGLKVDDLMQMRPDEQFVTILNALEKIENPTLRTATALEIFGRSGRQVINMLGDLQSNVDEARSFNDKFNISLSAIDAAKVEEANDRFGRVKAALSGIGNTVAVELAPLLTELSNNFINGGISAQTFESITSKSMAIVAGAVDVARGAVLLFQTSFIGIQTVVTSTIVFSLKKIRALAQGIVDLLNLIPGAKFKINDSFDALIKSAESYGEKTKTALKQSIDEAKNFESTLKKIEDIQDKANKRLANKDTDKPALLDTEFKGVGNGSGAKKTSDEVTNLNKELDKSDALARDLGRTFESSFEQAFTSGQDLRGVMRGLLSDIQRIVLRRTVSEPIGDLISGAVSEGGLGNIFKGIGSKVTGLFSGASFATGIDRVPRDMGAVASYATGIDRVPRDMYAKLHAGERVIPRQRVNAMERDMSSGESTIINQNINVTTGVQQTVRAEIARMLPQISQASVGAVQGASSRNKVKL